MQIAEKVLQSIFPHFALNQEPNEAESLVIISKYDFLLLSSKMIFL